MKIETARKILKQYNCIVPKDPCEAKDILDRYSAGEIEFCGEGINQEGLREIYYALTVLQCSEMGREHAADPKRADRQAAEEKKQRRNNGWRS
jgi:hypothetical protein